MDERLAWVRSGRAADAPLRRRRRLHRQGADRQPARRLHRRPRGRRRDDAGARARAGVVGDGVRVAGGVGRARADPDLHARGRAAVRGAPDAGLGVRARSAASADRDPPRDQVGDGAGSARAGGRTDFLRLDDAAEVRLARVRARRRIARGARRGVRPAGRRVPPRPVPRVRGVAVGRRSRFAAAELRGAQGLRRRHQLLRAAGRPLEDAHVRPRKRCGGGSRDGVCGRAARRSPAAARVDRRPATRSRSSRAWSWGVRRGSTRGRSARRRRSSASRSAAARSSSRAASSACRESRDQVPRFPARRPRSSAARRPGLARTRRRSSRRAGGCGTRRRSGRGCPRPRSRRFQAGVRRPSRAT